MTTTTDEQQADQHQRDREVAVAAWPLQANLCRAMRIFHG
jgi:hypothetical protein